jgi:hypothetical protein
MKPREKLIAGSLAAVVGAYVIVPMIWNAVFGAFSDLNTKIEMLTAQRDAKDKQVLQGTLAAKMLGDARKRSLPPDAKDAARLYQEWLVDVAKSCGLTNVRPKVERMTPQPDVYVAVPISFQAEGTYEQAVRFLARFSEVDLLQRLATFHVMAPSPNSPKLEFDIRAEALSLKGATKRNTIFPRTQLTGAVTAQQTDIPIRDSKEFPAKAPFRVRIGQEWMNVEVVAAGHWTVERAVGGSKADAHAPDSAVELTPLRAPKAGERDVEEQAEILLAHNFFAKPRPKIKLNPKLSPSGVQLIAKGSPSNLTIKAETWDPALGTPQFAFEGEAPKGATLDAKTGAFKWTPESDLEPGEYKVHIVATASDDPEAKFSTELVFKVREANRAPKFKKTETAVAYLGRPMSIDLSAEDPDAGDRIRYSLTGEKLEGAELDARSGKLTWTPTEDLEAKEYKIEVTATDNGNPPLTDKKTLTIITEEDAARFTKLVRIVSIDGDRHAGFYDSSINKSTVVHLNESFRFADVKATVVEIAPEYIVFDAAGARMRLDLGKTLRDMTPVAGAAASSGSKSSVESDRPPAPPGSSSEGEAPAPGVAKSQPS